MSPKRSAKIGLPPGTLVHVGEPSEEPVGLSLMDFGPEHFEERALANPDELIPYLRPDTVTWLNVTGVHRVEVVARIGELLGIHPLVQEDVVNTHQRPKAEAYDGYLYLVVRMIRYDAEDQDLDTEQVSLILRPGLLVTFQEKEGDVFDAVRQRIRGAKGRLRTSGADYLAYALLDSVVDHYFLALEGIWDTAEEIEEEVINEPSPETLETIHRLKRTAVQLRRSISPVRELVLALERDGSALLAASTQPFLRDLYDHTVQVVESLESLRDVMGGYVDLYLSTVNNRMNEVMKVLTIIATVFIPLTFLAGIYGMNFEHMPELRWPWAYPALLLLMGAVAGGMFVFFRRKRWL